ncbi:MAG TPA: carboxypeptidase regulatory-like domain-containing protein [Opitutaceae bacterium]|nr:carboxypeptidase regulatory-like domain-containing protein [Opitutaceae bacterium]
MKKTTVSGLRGCVSAVESPSPFRGGRPVRWLSRIALACASLLAPLHAQSTGAVEGRVQNVATGAYLANARVGVKGTNLVTFTDEAGTFRLSGVPAGATTLRVFFTGLDEQEVAVDVPAGQAAARDIQLTSRSLYGAPNDTVKLDPFTVQSTRETNAAAIAINSQRFAPNITSVVSTDEFGTIADTNPGEFLKWLPGVDIETFANNIVGVSVRGLGATNTELNFDGMPQASMNAEAADRKFEVQYASAADIARVEIRKIPLPEDSANALGGSINLIRRSAFEYSKRRITYRALFTSDAEKFTLKDIDGPKDRGVQRWQPNWQVSWTEPVNRNFGFAVTAGQDNQVVNTHWSFPTVNFGSAANNTAAAAAIAAGRPYNQPSIFTPAVSQPGNHNAPLMQGKLYGSVRADWRPLPELTLGASFSGTKGWKQVADDIRYQWNAAQTGTGDVARFVDPTTTLGRPGGAKIFHSSPLWRDIDQPNLNAVLEARWRKNLWTASAKASWSHSRYSYFDTEHGFFGSTSGAGITDTGIGSGSANPIPLTVNFYDINDWSAPRRIEAFTTANGQASTNAADYTVPVEWWKNSVARIGGARARPGSSKEIVSAVKLFVKRDFNFENPLSLQLGYDYTDRFRNRRYDYYKWDFVGADGRAGTADDAATLIAAESLPARRDAVYDFPAIERISMTKLYSLYQQHPTWFVFDENNSFRGSMTQQPQYDLTEKQHMPYLQFDSRVLKNRLRLTGGVRYEKLEAVGRGLLTDNSAAFQKYSDGSVRRAGDVVGANGLPTTRAGTPVFLPGVTTGSLAQAQLIYKAKGARAESGNDNYFPSLHASYSITDNLTWQIAYAKTQAKIDFQRSAIPQNDISDTPVTTGNAAGALGLINIRNPDLKPWVGQNYETRLAYYTNSGGIVGVGLYRKNISDYQITNTTGPLSRAELSADWGFGPEYEGYAVSTRFNQGGARLDGAELELSQSLDRILPNALRGFRIGGTVAYNNLSKAQPTDGGVGTIRTWRDTARLSYVNRRFRVNLLYQMNGDLIENAALVSNGFQGQQVIVRQDIVDVNVEYSVTKWARVFFSAYNIGGELRRREQRFPDAKMNAMTQSNTFGNTYTIGVTGTF